MPGWFRHGRKDYNCGNALPRTEHPMMAEFDPNDPEALERMRAMFSPGQLDSMIRQAIQIGWMMLPADKRTVDELEAQLRRTFDRAIANLRDDSDAFGFEK
jgi:hypothetical protein